jgi:hypothetical protein
LKSDSAVQSVALYSIDGFRFAVEYGFRNKDNRAVVSDIELIIDADEPVTQTDRIPREVSQETATEAEELESSLDLSSNCHLTTAFDNLFPEPKARADWLRMDWPKE